MRDRVLKPRTAELYNGLLANHLYPTFGDLAHGRRRRGDASVAGARNAWRPGPKAKRPFGPVTVAKAYRLLHAIFETAAEEDRIIPRNPCHIDGAARKSRTNGRSFRFLSSSRSPRPFRCVTAPWCCSPPSRTCDGANWPGSAARISTWRHARSGSRKHSPSSTRAGCAPTRQSRAPVSALSRFPPRSPRRSYGTSSGSPNRGSGASSSSGQRAATFAARTSAQSVWDKVRQQVGLPNLHFHDLRHTGGTLSAATGATLKELMARLGHSSVRAAMIYQHATRDRDQAIAKALGTFFRDIHERRGKGGRATGSAESRAHDPRDRVARAWHAESERAVHGMRSNTEKCL